MRRENEKTCTLPGKAVYLNNGGVVDKIKNVRSDVLLPKESEAVSKIAERVKNAGAGEVWEIYREDLHASGDGIYSGEGIKRALGAVESAIKDSKYEVFAVFDEDGRFIGARSDGKEYSVNPGGFDTRDKITTHNHPAGKSREFSAADVMGGLKAFERETRMVNKAGETFSLIRVSDERIREFYNTVKYEFTDGYNIFAITRSWLKKHAKEYGYRYEETLGSKIS
jgi:hypothetical protein